MLAPPSLTRDYPLVYSGDPALDAPGPDADEREQRDWQERLERARETGLWTPLLKPGQEPTVFVMRHLTGSQRRELADMINEQGRGLAGKVAIVFRAAVKQVTNLPGAEIRLVRDPDTGLSFKIASPDIVNVLDDIDSAIIAELSDAVARRMNGGPGPKS